MTITKIDNLHFEQVYPSGAGDTNCHHNIEFSKDGIEINYETISWEDIKLAYKASQETKEINDDTHLREGKMAEVHVVKACTTDGEDHKIHWDVVAYSSMDRAIAHMNKAQTVSNKWREDRKSADQPPPKGYNIYDLEFVMGSEPTNYYISTIPMEEDSSKEFKPCPHCGCGDVRYRNGWEHDWRNELEERTPSITCNECEGCFTIGSIGIGITDEYAKKILTKAYNRRSL